MPHPRAAVALFGLLGRWQTAQAGEIRIARNIAYGPSPEEILDICMPKAPAGRLPGIVLIHGGGWSWGAKEGPVRDCTFMAQHGFVVANIDYRLGNSKDPHGAPWPAQLLDAQLAVRWLRAHAADYSLDPAKICSWGESAGGHLAVFLGVLSDNMPGPAGDPAPGLYPEQSSAVACVVDGFGPVDFLSSGDRYMKSLDQGVFGGATAADHPDLLRQASPVFDVTPRSAPMLILHGLQDSFVDIAQSMELIEALRKNGVPDEHIFYRGDHSFTVTLKDNPPKTIPEFDAIHQQQLDFVSKWLLHP